jgi:predicted DNA-binding transcriptional regulator AlpA
MATAAMPLQQNDDEVFEFDEAAAFLKVSRSWLEHSDVPRARLGRRVVFLRSQLLAYVAARLTHRVDVPTLGRIP